MNCNSLSKDKNKGTKKKKKKKKKKEQSGGGLRGGGGWGGGGGGGGAWVQSGKRQKGARILWKAKTILGGMKKIGRSKNRAMTETEEVFSSSRAYKFGATVKRKKEKRQVASFQESIVVRGRRLQGCKLSLVGGSSLWGNEH